MAENEETDNFGIKKIKVAVDRNPETESLIAENLKLKEENEALKAEETAKKETRMMEQFELLKSEMTSKYGDQGFSDCNTPSEIMDIISQIRGSKPTEQKRAPAGKSTLLPPSSGETFEDQKAMVDELYRRAYYDKDPLVREKAKTQIDELFTSLVESPNWRKKAMSSPNIMNREFSDCPKCRRTLEGDNPRSCPYCGWKADGKHRVYRTEPTADGPDKGFKVF